MWSLGSVIFPVNADAATVADIMNGVTKFGSNTTAARTGGVRGADKYLKSMTFTPEPSGNRIVIRGEYEDYLKAKEIIERLDEPQPQVAVLFDAENKEVIDKMKAKGAQFIKMPDDVMSKWIKTAVQMWDEELAKDKLSEEYIGLVKKHLRASGYDL